MDFDDQSSLGNRAEKLAAYQLIKKFSKEVLLRMKQYRDDLLAACLTLILSLPKEVIADQMADIIPAIQTTFTIGLSYLPLANIGLGALECWSQQLPASLIEPYYSEILPCLDAYLRTDGKGCFSKSTVLVQSKKSKVKVPVRLVRGNKSDAEVSSCMLVILSLFHFSIQLSKIKLRILHYLGSLGGQINHALLAHSDDEISKEAISWDTQNHLKFDVPFFDMKPSIYFDPFLPQVVKLAQQSSDRQTKVAACELLHSLVLYALGRGAHLPGETQKKYPMERLYQKLFPSLLSLACDVEQVCKDLFEPLMMQLIHWFTNNKMAESPETMALLDCIFDGLIQSTDTALRDFSAKCLREFLKWSLKQISKKAAEKNPINAKSVFKRIHSYSSHPSAFKRLGAALAFNNIYMVFREEDALIDRFTFDTLSHFVDSLSMAHEDDKSLGTQEQSIKALEHLERIIKGKAEMLKKDPGPKIRPEPSSWRSRKLEHAVRWLTRQCGNPQTECRHICMKLVFNLCTLLPGNFFDILHKAEGASYFLKRFEGGGHASSESHCLLSKPIMTEGFETFTLSTARKWFDYFLAALDCYCWVFGEGLMVPTQIFKGQGSEMSCLFKSLSFFLEKLSLSDVESAACLFPQRESSVFTPWEKDEYSRLKCTVIIRIWNFFSILLAKFPKDVPEVVPTDLWKDNLWQLLCFCVVKPSALGFNMSDTEIMLQLPKEMNTVLQVMNKHLPDSQQKQLNHALTHHLASECNLSASLPINLAYSDTDHTQLAQMVEGYRQLHSTKLLEEHLPKPVARSSLASKLLDNVFEGIVDRQGDELGRVNLSQPAINLAKSLLMLSLELDLPPDLLVAKLLDKSKVQGHSKRMEVNHGDYFFTILGSTIAAFLATSGRNILASLLRRTECDSPCIGNVLVAVLDLVTRDRSLRKRDGVRLCQDILDHWDKLSPWWGDRATTNTQSLALLILTKLLLIDSKCATDSGHKSFASVFSMYQLMLKDVRTTMSFKNQALNLLAFFALLKGRPEEELKDTLNRFIADNFPLKSSEFEAGTPKFKDYIMSIDKILMAMEMTGSLMLLEMLISVYCKEGKHPHEEAIQLAISRFVQRLPLDQQRPAIEVPLGIFLNTSFTSEIRRAAIESVCLPMLRKVSPATMKEFFCNQIHELINYIDVKLTTTSENLLETQLTCKICSFQLLEGMYGCMSKDEVNSKSSVINRKFCNGKDETGKEMTQKITKCANDAKSEDTRGETMLVNLRRQYHCYAYNLLVSIISCVQTDIKFYKGFLFQDNVARGQFLLDNIVDLDRVFEFEVDLKDPIERHKRFVSIRHEAREKRGDLNRTVGEVTPSLHLATQYLADSSLTDDLNQYDFNMSNIGQSGSYGQGSIKITSRASSEDDPSVYMSVSDEFIELDMDELNRHECMAPLIALLKHMAASNVTPEIPKGALPAEMPAWMPYLQEKMINSSTHLNIKLFIAKLVMNCGQIFQPYAKFWLRPLCQLILTPAVNKGGLNYFVVDVVITMITWHTAAIPGDSVEERAMASCIVRLIVENIYHSSRNIYRNNLQLLKIVLECWHDRVDLPYDAIYNMLKNAKSKALESTTGVQVVGVLLACKFPPYGPSAPVDKDRYLSTLSNLMNHGLKLVYAATAEVVGLIFRHLADVDKETDGTFHETTTTHLTGLANSRVDIFITCVHGIHLSYPPFTARFTSKLLYLLPKLHAHARAQCLEVILGHVDHMENAYQEMNSQGLADFLTHRDEETQIVSLKIVRALMVKLTGAELLHLLQAMTRYSGKRNPSCRKIILDILMWAYDNYRDLENDINGQVMILTKEALLKGLCDEDLPCRLTCQNFWSSDTRLPEGTLERTISMLEAMYSPNTEPHYLAYATNLLLQATSKSPDYQREIFEHALSECTFQEYSVHSSWRQRHAVMTPLFASTLVTQPMDTGEDSLDGGLRATQDVVQFTATMDMAGSGRAFNWLTQSSLDTYDETGTIAGGTQLLFRLNEGDASSRSSSRVQRRDVNVGQGYGAQKTLKLKTAASGDNKPSASVDETDGFVTSVKDVWRLKRRFIQDQSSQSVFHMRRNIQRNMMKEEVLKEQKARRENQVTLYRKYRIGDLPDIQIKYQYIIAPLQALAHHDSTIARLLFSSLFQAIFHDMDKVKTEREIEELVKQINSSIETILRDSVHYFPPFMGAIMTILYELRSRLKVPAGELGTCAITSNQQTLGIMILEEQLIQSDARQAESTSKRARQSRTTQPDDFSEWVQLSRLYKSLHDFDVIQGIFSDKLSTREETRNAIEAEARCDFKTANHLYEKAITKVDWPDGDPLEAEVDFWDDSRMECLDSLCQWKDLETISAKGVDNSDNPILDRVWEDGFYQEHYLPYVLRSKLKLLQSGDLNQQPLLTFIDTSMTDPHKKQHLESRYSTELALLYLWQKCYDRSRHYTGMAFESFLQEWSNTTTLMVSSRRDSLHKLQGLFELQEFLDFLGSNNLQSSLPALMNGWDGRFPHLLLDPVTTWDDVVTNRTVYLNQIIEKLTGETNMNDSITQDSVPDQIQLMKISLRLAMAESCQRQNNSSLTLRLLRDTQAASRDVASKEPFVEWSHLYAVAHHSKATGSAPPWEDETFTNIVTTLDLLRELQDSPVLQKKPDLGLRHHVLTGQGYKVLAMGLLKIENLSSLKKGTVDKLISQAPVTNTGDIKEKLIGQLISNGFKSMKIAVSQNGFTKGHEKGRQVMTSDEANLELAKFCDKYLIMREQIETFPQGCDLTTFPETVVVCLLNAMKGGVEEARERFPRLLQLAEHHTEVRDVFMKKAEEVPCWMFLMWVSQMTALLDKPECVVVAPILTHIADDYPQALIYPLRMSSDGFNFKSGDKKRLDKVAELTKKTDNVLVNKFISALEQFGQPDVIFKDWCTDMKKLLGKAKVSKEEITRKYKEIYRELLDVNTLSQSSSDVTQTSLSATQSSVGMGEYRKGFAKNFKVEFEKFFGSNGEKLTSMKLKNFQEADAKLRAFFEGKRGVLNPPTKLKDYSPWLAEFNSNKFGDLEIPGQYTGQKKPLPEYHVKISGFDERVLVMASLRKPKRIMIRGNDEKDYPYLVKSGEDLRLDQRIETLFFVMNKVMNSDPACRQRKLQLKTYQVISMTPRVGLIEWMQHTKPLKHFLYEALTDEEHKFLESDQGPSRQHNRWISKLVSTKDQGRWQVIYDAVYMRYSYTETVKEFRQKEGKVPWDLSRRAIQKMSSSPEAFHALRSALIKSHATICICQYLLGIGDRHLSNFMVHLKTGQMIGIDFGHAFGSATQFLPVPELIPFRLTRQLTNLNLPLQVKGQMESAMKHVLRALRADSDLLLCTMDVFVKEPHLDWLNFAERQLHETREKQATDSKDNDDQWYPKEKIKFARRKLRGDHPASIMKDELHLGHSRRPEACRHMVEVLNGRKKEDGRSLFPANGLTVEEQVAALVDQATDPNILGRTWVGWEPWF
ncbi:unnamed protein product [Lymnaea stagnalis]|uniref:DNA-dependent protein kinase catalytic subunit n=1 Tax=Lymnaea stagnalis TaxID=6523 RepID=A0AAV2IAA2_LYMST